jgi:hypothetical protein
MTRQLKIDENKSDLISGSYDPRTDWTREFGVDTSSARPDTTKDEEIAKLLQLEQFNPEANFISKDDKVPIAEESSKRKQIGELRDLYSTENLKQQALNAIEKERQKKNRQSDLDNEIQKMRDYNTLATQRALLRSTYDVGSYYLDPYERLYNWSLTLLPDYYDYMTRRRLRESLARLIKRELRFHSSESELEEKVRDLIRSAEYSENRPKSRPKRRVKSKAKSKTKRKSKKK